MTRADADPLPADTAYEVILAFDQEQDDVGENGVNGGGHGTDSPSRY
jgi:hypothetical protein